MGLFDFCDACFPSNMPRALQCQEEVILYDSGVASQICDFTSSALLNDRRLFPIDFLLDPSTPKDPSISLHSIKRDVKQDYQKQELSPYGLSSCHISYR